MNCIVGKTKPQDVFKQIVKDLVKFFLIVTAYLSSGVFKKYPIESDRLLFVRFDGLGDTLIFLYYLVPWLKREKKQADCIVNSKWLSVLYVFNKEGMINFVPFDRDNPIVSSKRIFDRKIKWLNVYIPNATPDLYEVYIACKLGMNIHSLPISSANISSVFSKLIYPGVNFLNDCKRFNNEFDYLESLFKISPDKGWFSHAIKPHESGYGSYIVVCPNSSDPRKDPTIQQIALLVKDVIKDREVSLVIVVGVQENFKLINLLQGFNIRVIDLINKLDLYNAISLCSNADLFLGADTGLAHAAILSNVKSYVFFGNMHGSWYTPPKDRFVNLTPVRRSDVSCGPCNYNCIFPLTSDGKFRCIGLPYEK
jgi:hypothetical protein